MQPISHGGGFFDDEEELIAAIERSIGPETAEAARRSQQLARNPRALTDAERAELRADLEPILRDMHSSGAIVPDILEEAHDDFGPDCVCAWIQSPGDAGSQGIRVQAGEHGVEGAAGQPGQAHYLEAVAGLARIFEEDLEDLGHLGSDAAGPV